MNKEQQELLDEVYKNYKSTTLENDMKKSAWELTVQSMSGEKFILSQEEFINKCKTDTEFSEKWGLKIEERELNMMERWAIADLTPNMEEFDFANYMCDKHNVPTKLITITYKKTKLESYENNS